MGLYYSKARRLWRARIYRDESYHEYFTGSFLLAQQWLHEMETKYPARKIRQSCKGNESPIKVEVPCGYIQPANSGRCYPGARCEHFKACLTVADKWLGWKESWDVK